MQEFSRVNRPVLTAASYYTRLAPIYDILANSEKRFVQAGIELLNLVPGERILEIGSGTGYAQERLCLAINGGVSIGLDLSPGMIQITLQRLARVGLQERANLIQSDTLPIPIQKNSMDGVFSSFTLELFDTPLIPEVLGEIRRVLKPGGRLVVVSLSKDRPLGLIGKIYESFHDYFPKLADCRPIPVRYLLEEGEFKVQESYDYKMWGIPVGIVLATTPI